MSNKVFVMSAPAGAGKTTLAKLLIAQNASIELVPTLTTRACRPGEVSGVDYIFVSKEEFDRRIFSGDFVEYIELHGNYYGTSRSVIQEVLSRDKHVLLVIDSRGARVLKQEFGATLIYILPPSKEALRLRLEKRASEDIEVQKKRLAWGDIEIEDQGFFDFTVVNDQLKVAFEELQKIIHLCISGEK